MRFFNLNHEIKKLFCFKIEDRFLNLEGGPKLIYFKIYKLVSEFHKWIDRKVILFYFIDDRCIFIQSITSL